MGAILVVERNQHPVIVQENGIHKNFNQCFTLFFLRNIEFSKFQQPEPNEILIEAGLLQFFICNFCSQLILLNFQRFQTFFRCPGVQAILNGFHQVVQLLVYFPELLFQQRDRGILLILYIHDQLNDLVDHRIVLNQLHGFPDDQFFQPVLLHGLFVAALAPLDVGAFIIIVGASGGTGSAFAEHQRTALAAEQLGGQQIFLVCLVTGRGALVLVHTLLHPVKQVFRNDSRNCIWYNDVSKRQFTNVTTVLQHGVHAAVGHFAAQHIADTLVVEEVYDLHHLIAVVIPLKGFQYQRSGQRVKVIKLFLVDFVAYGSRTASALPFQSIFGLASNDLFGKFCGIVFSHTFQKGFHQNALRALGNGFHDGNQMNAVLFRIVRAFPNLPFDGFFTLVIR